MVLSDPESSPADRALSGAERDAGPAVSTAATPSSPSFSRLLACATIAALIAGAVSLLAGEAIMSHFRSDLLPKLAVNPNPEDMRRFREARLYSAALTFATMGGLLGLALGVAGGLARRSAWASVRAGFVGLVLGTAAAAGVAYVVVSIFYKQHDPQSGDLLLPLLTHGAIWSTVGAVAGLAFGLGIGAWGRWPATLVGGLVGAATATILYELIGALAFASSKTDLPLSSSMTTRGMAQLLVAIFSSLGAAVALRDGFLSRRIISIAIGTDDLAAVARAQRLVGQHADRVLDEPDASVGECEIAPAGMIAAGIDETRPLRRSREATSQAAIVPRILFRVRGDDRIEERITAFAQCPELTVVLLHTDHATCRVTLSMWPVRCPSRIVLQF